MANEGIIERLPAGWVCRECGKGPQDGALPFYRRDTKALAIRPCRDCESAQKRAAYAKRSAAKKAATGAPPRLTQADIAAALKVWRCRECKRTKRSATPLFGVRGLPLALCDACRKEQQRQHSARMRARGEALHSEGVGRLSMCKFTVAELSAKYLGNAARCERQAQAAEREGERGIAYRLRDQANDWRALARHPHAG